MGFLTGKFDNVKPGDCVVCFNKNDIYHVSQELEKRGKDVAVIYGTLPAGLYACDKSDVKYTVSKC